MKEISLRPLGLLKSEEKTYFALLKLGPSSAGIIARQTGLNRVSVYKALEKLSKSGLVTSVIKSNRKCYESCSPSSIKLLIKEKEDELSLLKNKIPEMTNLFQENNEGVKTKIYKEMKGAKTIWSSLLQEVKNGDEWLIIGAPKSADLFAGYFNEFNKERARKKVSLKIIYNSDAKDLREEREKQKLVSVRVMPKEYVTPASIEIVRDNVLIVLYEPEIIVFHMKDIHIAKSFKVYFDLLWKIGEIKRKP
ncbi:MAG: hypothetical protein KKB31_05330 [Nanoarchaeota archaeon]|nr:hypothetical protein [Nanoarchaeota archaeon]